VLSVAGESPAFEPALRLAKRWVGAQLLSPHLGEEAVELLLAHCFCASGRPAGGARGGAATAPASAAPAPASRLSGLLRFLHLLAHHPWRVAPLVVDPNGEMSAAQRDAAVRAHAPTRAAGAAPALCLVTPRDPGGGAWTASRPSPQMLHRIAVLAARSAAALEAHLLGGAAAAGPGGGSSGASPTADPSQAGPSAAAAAVFAPDLSEYDVLLRLRPDALPNAANRLRLGGGERGGARAARPPLGPALRAVGEQLAAEAAAAAGCKLSRAILKGIPQSEWAGGRRSRGGCGGTKDAGALDVEGCWSAAALQPCS
jgi:U3 small nucleolar RNA-associated protein 22